LLSSRATIPDGQAILEVKEGRKWEYRVEGKSTFRRSGVWDLESGLTTSSNVALGLRNFDLGLPQGKLAGLPHSFVLF
jgi:hypothetical protein